MEAAHLYASEDPSESGDSTAAAGGLVKVCVESCFEMRR